MRKNILALSSSEFNALVTALNRMKSSGAYDQFTMRHMRAMMELTLFPNEQGTLRNVAHRGPVFLPWHRRSLWEFERALGVPVPYWSWEGLGSSWQSSRVWSRIGGNGSSSTGRVTNGPFSGWRSVIWSEGKFYYRSGILRRFRTGTLQSVPLVATYDSSPWSESTPTSQSFRRLLETRHNLIHSFVGGDLSSGTSPNDPLFWFHHSNVDRIYYRWQRRYGYTTYSPGSGGPPGHNRNDTMRFLRSSVRVSAGIDPRPLGISYDTLD